MGAWIMDYANRNPVNERFEGRLWINEDVKDFGRYEHLQGEAPCYSRRSPKKSPPRQNSPKRQQSPREQSSRRQKSMRRSKPNHLRRKRI